MLIVDRGGVAIYRGVAQCRHGNVVVKMLPLGIYTTVGRRPQNVSSLSMSKGNDLHPTISTTSGTGGPAAGAPAGAALLDGLHPIPRRRSMDRALAHPCPACQPGASLVPGSTARVPVVSTGSARPTAGPSLAMVGAHEPVADGTDGARPRSCALRARGSRGSLSPARRLLLAPRLRPPRLRRLRDVGAGVPALGDRARGAQPGRSPDAVSARAASTWAT